MRTIIAGSRTIKDKKVVWDAINSAPWQITEVLSGAAVGVDLFGEQWARCQQVPYTRYLAEWAKYGRRAGPIRNARMAQNADALIAVWDGKSRGTKNMIEEARAAGLEIHTWIYHEGVIDI